MSPKNSFIPILSLAIACSPGGETATTRTGAADEGDAALLEAGGFTTWIPSPAAGDEGVAVRVSFPASDRARYPVGAPVVVRLGGGWLAGSLPDGPDRLAMEHGYVSVHVLLPGGVSGDWRSGGALDRRGAGSVRAVQDVLRFAAGDVADVDGQALTDHVPHARPDVLGLVGVSNGGNLALVALADDAEPEVDFLITWESPIGDQFQTVELNDDPTYAPGTCGLTTCPTPGLEAYVRFDPQAQVAIRGMDPTGPVTLDGALYLDLDGDGRYGDPDAALARVLGAHGEVAYPSAELFALVSDREGAIFPDGPPEWWPTADEVAAFWADRDGSLHVEAVHARRPDLLVMHLQTSVDHVQTQPDFPHARSHVAAWVATGHGFVRLNPDASYLAEITRARESELPDNPANTLVPFPGTSDRMVPPSIRAVDVDAGLMPAAVLELADRTVAGERAPDLDGTLW